MDRVRARVRRGRARRGAGGLRLARAALRARLPAVGVPLPAHQPARRRLRRRAGEPLPLSARGVRGAARRLAATTARCRCASPRTTGRKAATRRTTPSRSRKLFRAAGADLIDVSSGQTTRAAKPVYGRMYQTPFADRVRNEAGIATMAVGAIFEPDHVNSILMAGRADLCALGAPAPGGPVLDAARGGAARRRGRRVAGAVPVRPRPARAQPRAGRADGRRPARRERIAMATSAERALAVTEAVASDHESRLADDHHESLRLWLRLLTCTLMIERRVRANLRERFAITLPRFDLMAQLERHPQGLRMGELSRRLMVTGGNVTGLTDAARRRGPDRAAGDSRRPPRARGAPDRQGQACVRRDGGRARALDDRSVRRPVARAASHAYSNSSARSRRTCRQPILPMPSAPREPEGPSQGRTPECAARR